MEFEVIWYDGSLTITAVREAKGRKARQYVVLMFPLLFNPMLRRDGHISFDYETGQLAAVCATPTTLHFPELYRDVYVALLGAEFWEACMTEEVKKAVIPLRLTMSAEAMAEVEEEWVRLDCLAREVAQEMDESQIPLEEAQDRVMGCHECRTDGYLPGSTQTTPVFCDCRYGAQKLLEVISCLGTMPNLDVVTVLSYWTIAREKVQFASSIARATLDEVDAARARLITAIRQPARA